MNQDIDLKIQNILKTLHNLVSFEHWSLELEQEYNSALQQWQLLKLSDHAQEEESYEAHVKGCCLVREAWLLENLKIEDADADHLEQLESCSDIFSALKIDCLPEDPEATLSEIELQWRNLKVDNERIESQYNKLHGDYFRLVKQLRREQESLEKIYSLCKSIQKKSEAFAVDVYTLSLCDRLKPLQEQWQQEYKEEFAADELVAKTHSLLQQWQVKAAAAEVISAAGREQAKQLLANVVLLAEKEPSKENTRKMKSMRNKLQKIQASTHLPEFIPLKFNEAADLYFARLRQQVDDRQELAFVEDAAREELLREMAVEVKALDINHILSFLTRFQQEWRQFKHPVTDKGREMNKMFRGICEKLHEKWLAYVAHNEKERKEIIEAVVTLCQQSEFHSAKKKFDSLKQRWKKCGPVPRHQFLKLNDKFKLVCKDFFDSFQAHFDSMRERQGEAGECKRKLLEEAEALLARGVDSKVARSMHELQERWRKAGQAGQAEGELGPRFSEICHQVFAVLKEQKADKHRHQGEVYEQALKSLGEFSTATEAFEEQAPALVFSLYHHVEHRLLQQRDYGRHYLQELKRVLAKKSYANDKLDYSLELALKLLKNEDASFVPLAQLFHAEDLAFHLKRLRKLENKKIDFKATKDDSSAGDSFDLAQAALELQQAFGGGHTSSQTDSISQVKLKDQLLAGLAQILLISTELRQSKRGLELLNLCRELHQRILVGAE